MFSTSLPKRTCAIVGLALALISITPAFAAPKSESWRRADGSSFEGRLVELYGGLALISGRRHTGLVALDSLTDEQLQRVAAFEAARHSAPSLFATSASPIAREVRKDLRVLQNGKVIPYTLGDRREPDVYLFYFSASWCGPCHRFLPRLTRTYERMQRQWPGVFELIMISWDEDIHSAEKYFREKAMPWLMLRFGAQAPSLNRWKPRGIPCLVAVTRRGDLLFHSYDGDNFLGPGTVLDKCEQLFPFLDEKSPVRLRSRHRLAVLQHQQAAGSGNASLQPYLTAIAAERAQFVPQDGMTFILTVDEFGRVTDASVENDPFSPLNNVFRRDLETWLFLPAIENGQPVASTARLPVGR